MAGVQDHHALLLPRRLVWVRAQGSIEDIDVVAVSREIEQISAFLPDAADRQRLTEIEIALQVALHSFNFIDLAVVSGHIRPRSEDNGAPQAGST